MEDQGYHPFVYRVYLASSRGEEAMRGIQEEDGCRRACGETYA